MLGILGDAKSNLAKFLFSDLQRKSKDQKHVLSGVTLSNSENLCLCTSWQMWVGQSVELEMLDGAGNCMQ